MFTDEEINEIRNYAMSLCEDLEPRQGHEEDVKVCEICKKHMKIAVSIMMCKIIDQKHFDMKELKEMAENFSKFSLVNEDGNLEKNDPKNHPKYKEKIDNIEPVIVAPTEYLVPMIENFLEFSKLSLDEYLELKEDENERPAIIALEIRETVLAVFKGLPYTLFYCVMFPTELFKCLGLKKIPIRILRKESILLSYWWKKTQQ